MAGWLAADRAASILSEQPSPREDRRVRPGEARMFTVLAGTKSDCGWNVRLYQVLCVTLGCALHERFKTRQFVLHGPAHARTLVSTAGHQIEGLVMALVRARHKSGYGARGASRQTAYGLVDGLLYRYLQAIDAGGLARLEVGHRPAPIPAALRDRAGRPFPTKRHRVTTRAMYDAGLWAGLCAVSSVTVARALERGLALAAKG